MKKAKPACQVCGKPVSTQQGSMTVLFAELHQFEKRYREWERKHPLDASGARCLSTVDLVTQPAQVEWRWGHTRCLPEGGYQIVYGRFDTITQALAWTLHLMGKGWLEHTNWEAAVRAHHAVGGA